MSCDVSLSSSSKVTLGISISQTAEPPFESVIEFTAMSNLSGPLPMFSIVVSNWKDSPGCNSSVDCGTVASKS